MNGIVRVLFFGVALLLCSAADVFSQYTLVLKNGRRITVQSYREEGGMIKFQGLGGEIGISRDQVQTILKAGEIKERGMVIDTVREKEVRPAPETKPEQEVKLKETEKPAETKAKALSPEEQLAEERAKEEKEYQRKVKELTEQLKAARERYLVAARGKGGPDPSVPSTEEEMRARQDLLMSRLRDAQHNPAGPSDAGPIKLLTPSPFTGLPPTITELRPGEVVPRVDVPPPTYSEKERELSELRKQISQLEKQRERLIEEMKSKNFDTGSLFLD